MRTHASLADGRANRNTKAVVTMQIGILQCGEAPPNLTADHGTYGAMVTRLVSEAGPCRIFDVTRGELPEQVEICDAYVLTGSPAGVYESLPWINPLADFLLRARGTTKMVGICFGHQMLAQTFGGQVVKSPKGWGIGVHRYEVVAQAPWMDDSPTISVPASHQDQVVACPPDARVLLRSAFTPYAGLDYGHSISFQCHPEFTTGFGTALIASRHSLFGAMTEQALASYAEPDDRARLGRWIREFIRLPIAG